MTHPVVFFELMGGDGDRLRQFYGDLFGWSITEVDGTEGGYRRVQAQESGIAGGIGAFPGAPTYLTVYVRVDDLGEATERAVSLGGRIVMTPRVVTGSVETALIEDPDGHLIGLIRGL